METNQVKVEIKGARSVETILPREMAEITDLPAAFLHAVEDGAIGSAPPERREGFPRRTR